MGMGLSYLFRSSVKRLSNSWSDILPSCSCFFKSFFLVNFQYFIFIVSSPSFEVGF